ncbi:MAG TPA: hypothetical protein VFF52_25260 [Isosphaeraceae bacterium]|nr:hypothetical protein [Isosphaeraceae bacterium]
MRVPQLRFTMRRMMAAVAVVAILFGEDGIAIRSDRQASMIVGTAGRARSDEP